MGSIYRRPRSKYLWIKYHQNGRVVRESSGTTKETVARRMLRVREGDVERGIPITPKSGRVTFDEAAADVVNDYRTNGKKSGAHVQRRIDLHLRPYFQGRRLAMITTVDVRAFIAQRQLARLSELAAQRGALSIEDLAKRANVPEQSIRRAESGAGVDSKEAMRIAAALGVSLDAAGYVAGSSNGEINRELSVLKRMFSLACQAGKLHARPHIPMLQERNVRTGFFEPEQYQSVVGHLPAALQPVATFAYLTGWRVQSEVLTLQWRQVDLGAGVVRLDADTTKNSDGRVLPFGDIFPELRELLEAQRDSTKVLERKREVIIPWVFHRNGKPIRSFYGAWRAACTAAGCPGRIPHDFRRTAVRNLVRAGVPERVAMQITGHKTRSVFDRYDIVNEADLRAGLQKLSGTLPGTPIRIGLSAKRNGTT